MNHFSYVSCRNDYRDNGELSPFLFLLVWRDHYEVTRWEQIKGRDCDNLHRGGHVSDRVALCIEKSPIMFSGSWWLHHMMSVKVLTRTLYEYLMPMKNGSKGPDGRVGWFRWWEISCLCAHIEKTLDLQNWNIQLDQRFTSNTVNDYYIPGMHIHCSTAPEMLLYCVWIPSPPYNRWASLNKTWTSSHTQGNY